MTRHQVNSSGVRVYSDDAIFWDDVRVAADRAKLLGNSDPSYTKFRDNGAGSTGVYAYAFSKTTLQELMFSVQFTHAYKIGTAMEFHVHWATNTTKTGTVRWGVEFIPPTDIEADFPLTQIAYADAVISENNQYKHKYKDVISVDASHLQGVSSMMLCRVYRDAPNDNFDDVAFLLEVDFHVQLDTRGSLEETVK